MNNVKTGKVQGRRNVTFRTLDDVLVDVKGMAGKPHRTLGNWSFPQIVQHLAIAIATSIDGPPFKAPWPLRQFAKLFLKKRFLTKTLSPGFILSKKAVRAMIAPVDITLEQAVAALQESIERVNSTELRAPHGLFDMLSAEESDQFHMRHAEMHMSFVVEV